MPFLKLDGVDYAYNGTKVLKQISLSVETGEKVALVGKSGAGKSTLLKVLYRHQAANSALVPQDHALVKSLSVFHNVYMGRLNQHNAFYNLFNLMRPMAREVAAVKPLLEEMVLDDKMHTPVGELSGGQQQRTAVVRALFQGGQAVMGDEPVSALDPLQSRKVMAAINRRFDTVLMALHDTQLALDFTDRIIGLEDGRVILDEPSASLSLSDLEGLYQP